MCMSPVFIINSYGFVVKNGKDYICHCHGWLTYNGHLGYEWLMKYHLMITYIKMKKIIIYFTTIIVAITFSACCYCEDTYSNPEAALWKNGERQDLRYGKRSKNLFANSIFVYGNDLYVAGRKTTEVGYTALLWKNGKAQSLQGGNFAKSVFVVEEDIYVVGLSVGLGYFNPVYWKNGVVHRLTDKDENLYYKPSIFVSNNDVYIVWKDKVWKNDEVIQTVEGQVTSVFVYKEDVYVAGAENNKATVWKNGAVLYKLDNLRINYLYVTDNNVYAAGDLVLWKNGEILYEFEHYSIQSIFISGNDVYVATTFDVYKNGIVIFSDDSTSIDDHFYFSSVFVSNNDVYVAGGYSERKIICD